VLVGELFYAVVERGGADLALEERLADEVERVRSAAEAPVGGIETVLLSYYCNSTVVVSSVIKHEVTNRLRRDLKVLQRFYDDLGYALATVSACQLGQRYRQVLQVASAVDKVRNNA
jgi:predicted ATPase